MNSENFYAASAFFNGLFALFVVYYLCMRNRQNPLNRGFLAFGISVAGWCLIYALWGWADNAKLAEFYLRRHMMFAAFIPASFFHFAAQFSGKYEKLKRYVWVSYAVSAFYSLMMLTPYMIAGVKNVLFFKYWPVPGPILLSHVVHFFIVVFAGFSLLIRHCFVTRGPDRQRALLMLLAFTVGFGGGCINWFLWFDIPIPPTTNFFVGVMFAITAYAIVRHGLMDVDTVVEMLRYSRASSLGILASSMNHELRNPLFIAKGKLDTQLDSIERNKFNSSAEEAARSREVIESTLFHLNRAADIMQKFADFVRPNVKPAVKENILIRETVNDVLGLIQSQFQFQKIKVDDTKVNGAVVHANRRQFEEILFNLMVNACQAMNEEGGVLSLRAKKEQSSVALEVADSGPGMSKEQQKKAFEPFHSTKEQKGSGLGLYITKLLVERNGGKIELKSKAGQGSVFSMKFETVNK